MEMESSRRSIARSKEPGLKKPKLIDELERDRSSNGLNDHRVRSFPQRVSAVATPPSSTPPLLSRVRANERDKEAEKNDSSHGNGNIRHQQQQQLLQHSSQEIVSEYKTALGELILNSKPIITNLTIIAGENLQAAKWIAAIICANILEVPSDRKLPSLYLLDSIVKNIGKDYVRYFAAKLPEVFIKTYRQVDSSMRNSMQHLFATWKKVFPAAALQMIEKELGFSPAISVPSSGAPTSKPESKSQPVSHAIHVNPKYLEARQRNQQSGREMSNPVHKEYGGSGRLRNSDAEFGRADEMVIERDAPVSQRNNHSREHGFGEHQMPKTLQPVAHLQPTQSKSNGGAPRDWKYIEEEEYTWDEMNSKVDDHGVPDSSRKDGWAPDNARTLGLEGKLSHVHGEHNIGSRRKRETATDSLFMERKRQAGSLQDPRRVNGFGQKAVSASPSVPSVGAASTFVSLENAVSGFVGFLEQHKHLPRQPPSPSGQSSLHQHPYLTSLPSVLNQPQNMHNSSPPIPFPQVNKHSPFPQTLHRELTGSETSGQTQKLLPRTSVFGTHGGTRPSSLAHSNNTSGDAGKLTGGLLAAKLKSRVLDKPVSVQGSNTITHLPLPSDPPTLSTSIVPPVSTVDIASHGSIVSPSLTTNPNLPPPLPFGPPPASSIVDSTPTETSKPAPAVPNPLSSLLNTLVGKGLISAPAKESAAKVPSQLQNQSSDIVTINSVRGSSGLLSNIPSSSSGKELPSGSAAKSITTLSTAKVAKIKDLIGFEFKPEILRELHPSVINDLFDDLPHTCSICGLRLKLQEQLEKHLEWHTSKMHEPISHKNVSSRWYMSSSEWVSGMPGPTAEPKSVKTMERSHPAVPADENQSICLLCGDLFEDFYSFEKDTWMFRGAVYMRIPSSKAIVITHESSAEGPIVHASCLTPSSVYDLGLAKNTELDQTGLPANAL